MSTNTETAATPEQALEWIDVAAGLVLDAMIRIENAEDRLEQACKNRLEVIGWALSMGASASQVSAAAGITHAEVASIRDKVSSKSSMVPEMIASGIEAALADLRLEVKIIKMIDRPILDRNREIIVALGLGASLRQVADAAELTHTAIAQIRDRWRNAGSPPAYKWDGH